MSMYSEFTIIKSQVHAAVASKAIQGDRSLFHLMRAWYLLTIRLNALHHY